MRITGTVDGGTIGQGSAPSLRPSAAALYDAGGSASLERQLDAYRELSSRWRQSKGAEREALSQVLSDSPFGQRALGVLNRFTRAAWPGADAQPPLPQEKALQAFDSLSEPDREILAAMQADQTGRPAFASAAEYRAYLEGKLDDARPRRADAVTLSSEAQARLEGANPPVGAPPSAPPADARIASAMAAYAKAGG